MKKRLRVALLVVVLAALTAAMVGCGPGSPDTPDTRIKTYIESLKVDPPIGGGNFTLSVVYTFENDPIDVPENIYCRYVTPDLATMYIGSISPATSAKRPTGEITETAKLPFSITAKTNGVTPPGTYTVECSTDSAPKAVKTTFILTEEAADTTAPEIIVPADMTVEATGPTGAPVSFDVSATDLVDGALTPTANPASGSVLPLGVTTVTVSATDKAGNPASKSFTVTVKAAPAPALNGHWTGTTTLTSVKRGPYTGESWFKYLNVPSPITLDITLDAQGQGSVVFGGSTGSPLTVPASLVGDTLTLTMPQSKESSKVMKGQVSSDGNHINGTLTMTVTGDPGFLATYEWQVAR